MIEFIPYTKLRAEQLNQAFGSKVDKKEDYDLYPNADKDKLSGISVGATKNASDAHLLDRRNHTGTQSIDSVDGLQDALNSKADSSSLKAVATSGKYSDLTDKPTIPDVIQSATPAELSDGSETAQRTYAPIAFYDAAAFKVLVSSATIGLDLGAGNNFTLDLTHNAILANPTGAKSGQSGTIYISHSGENTLSFGSAWEFIGGVPELGDGSNADVLTYQVVSPTKLLAVMRSVG